jgi:hypothetical protein
MEYMEYNAFAMAICIGIVVFCFLGSSDNSGGRSRGSRDSRRDRS